MQSLRTRNKLTAVVNHAVPVTYEDMRALFAYSYLVSAAGTRPKARESLVRYLAMLFRAFACLSFVIWLRYVPASAELGRI